MIPRIVCHRDPRERPTSGHLSGATMAGICEINGNKRLSLRLDRRPIRRRFLTIVAMRLRRLKRRAPVEPAKNAGATWRGVWEKFTWRNLCGTAQRAAWDLRVDTARGEARQRQRSRGSPDPHAAACGFSRRRVQTLTCLAYSRMNELYLAFSAISDTQDRQVRCFIPTGKELYILALS